ncbi:MAG: TetR/AcrR family transcriptional regulator [Myxococcota bacterium]
MTATKALRTASAKTIGRPRTQDRAPGETRERLVEAAAEVFAELGYEGASIQSIAAAADLTSGTIYRHFDSKAALLLEVVRRAVHGVPLSDRLNDESCAEPADLARLVSVYADPSLRRTRRLAIEIHAAASRDPNARAQLLIFNKKMHSSIVRKIDGCKRAGLISEDLDAKHTTSLLLVMIMGLAHLETLEPDLVGDRVWTRFLESSVHAVLEDGN